MFRRLVLPIGVVFAFSAGWILSRMHDDGASLGEPSDRTEPLVVPERVDPSRTIDRSEPAALSGAPGPRASEHVVVDAGLISAALRRYAFDEMRAGWGEVRHDPMPEPVLTRGFGEFEEVVRNTPREIGKRLGTQQVHRDTLATTDAVAIVTALDADDLGPQLDLVRDATRFAALFDCSESTRLDGIAALADPRIVIGEGATLVFPPGVTRIGSVDRRGANSPKCLGIAGAGMDRTLIQMSTMYPGHELDRFRARDCTIDASGCVFSASAGPLVASFERVRFIGFDIGAGSSSLLYAGRGVALSFTDCRIEGGFGKSPQYGILFDVRSEGLLARFVRCRLSTLSLAPWLWRSAATIVFRDCSLTDLLDQRPVEGATGAGIAFESTTIEMRAPDAGPVPRRDLGELFPELGLPRHPSGR